MITIPPDLCLTCIGWAARSRQQLKVRRHNLTLGGAIHPCPSCGRTTWATSESCIVEQPNVFVRLWRRFLSSMDME